MYSHTTLGTNDLETAGRFYDAVLKPLGITRAMSLEGIILYRGQDDPSMFGIGQPFDGKPASAGNGAHIAFMAQDRAAVDAFHAAALAHGGTDEGAPGLRPHYHEHYYGAYVRDPEGNKLQAVCHAPPA
ncbi:MAG: VOC family protein [Alphaproteobacteria bacterium]